MPNNPKIQPGLYTVEDLLTKAGYDVSDLVDYRTVKIDGLGFDSLDKQIIIPEGATTIHIFKDGVAVNALDVENS